MMGRKVRNCETSYKRKHQAFYEGIKQCKLLLNELSTFVKSYNDQCVVKICKLLTIQDLIDTNIIPQLIDISYYNSKPYLQLESLYILSDIACGNIKLCI